MKLETIYNDLMEIIKDDMDFTKVLKLKEKLEKTIREETCYKTTSKTRINAIKRVASKRNDRPALTGYGICGDFKCITDSYHAVMLKDDNIPLKLVTTDIDLANKVGINNCINANYPNFKNIINFNKNYYKTITLDFDDIAQFYKLHNKNAEKESYKIEEQYFNIKYLKNVIDVLGTDIIVYVSNDNENRPIYFENKNGELGLVVPIRKY